MYAVFRGSRIDRDIDEELRFHLDMRIQENIRSGMSPEDAKREALRRFGNITRIKEQSHDIRGGGMIETFLKDIRYGVRMLIKQPLFTVAAVITLALGIGANTTVFSVVNAVVLRPLPFNEPDRLVMVWEVKPDQEKDAQVASLADFVDWRDQNRVFDGMAAYFNWTANLTGVDDPERIKSAVVTGSFFETLGVSAKIGRVLLPEDDRPGYDSVVLLSDGLWKRRFGGDPQILGKKLMLNGADLTVVGIMPPDFRFPDEEAGIWVPAGFGAKQLQDRRGKFINVIARLKPGIELNQAQAEMDTIAARLQSEYPETNADWGARVARLDDVRVGNVRLALFVLLGAVVLVLLIACVNVANLLLARAAARQREFAIRAALGASRARLFSQLLTESFLLVLLGGAAGVLLASWGVSLITSLNPGDIPRLNETTLDGRVLGFTMVISVISVMAFGLAPALFASRPDPQESLKSEGRGSSSGSKRRLRNALVISEVAVALMLLIGAGLMIKSFLRLQSVDPGFNSDNLLTLRVWLPSTRYKENHRQIAFFQQLINRIKGLPGVQSAGAVQDLPIRRNRMGYDFAIEGRAILAGDEPNAGYRAVTPDYFKTMSIPLASGRWFNEKDDSDAPPVVIINRSMARQFWSDEDPIGKRIRFGGEEAPWSTIVGVVGDVKHMGLDADEGPALYQPHSQKPEYLRWMTLVVRTNVEPLSIVSAVREQVSALDKDQPVYDVATMRQLVSESIANPRFYMTLLGLFAFVALILATVGVYGVLAFWVTQRTKEIGIHMALGAQQKDVMKRVMGKGIKLALTGVAIGLVGAFILTRALDSLLYNVSATDPTTFLAVSLLLIFVAALACYIPARRAMRVDPVIALRFD